MASNSIRMGVIAISMKMPQKPKNVTSIPGHVSAERYFNQQQGYTNEL
jgi:hypothetical protein